MVSSPQYGEEYNMKDKDNNKLICSQLQVACITK